MGITATLQLSVSSEKPSRKEGLSVGVPMRPRSTIHSLVNKPAVGKTDPTREESK